MSPKQPKDQTRRRMHMHKRLRDAGVPPESIWNDIELSIPSSSNRSSENRPLYTQRTPAYHQPFTGPPEAAPPIVARSHSVPLDYFETTPTAFDPYIVPPMEAPIPIPAGTRASRYDPLGPHKRRSGSALVRSRSSYLYPSSGNFGHQVERNSHFTAQVQQASERHIPRGIPQPPIPQPDTFGFSQTPQDPLFDCQTYEQQYDPSIFTPGASTSAYNYALPSPEEPIAGLQVPEGFSTATIQYGLPPYYFPGSGDFPSDSLSANGFSFPQATPNPQGNEDFLTSHEFFSDTEAN